MFESAKIVHHVDKAAFKTASRTLRTELVRAQFKLHTQKGNPVVILVAGALEAAKADLINALNDWMDPRGIATHALGPATDVERERPPMWRFWLALPPKGSMAIFFNAWYSEPLYKHIFGADPGQALDQTISEVKRFEQMLAEEGVVLVKLWLFHNKKPLAKKFKKLESDPKTCWRVTDLDRSIHKHYARFYKAGQHITRLTSTAYAPWHVFNAEDPEYAQLTSGRIVLAALRRQLRVRRGTAPNSLPPLNPEGNGNGTSTILDQLDLAKKLSTKAYDKEYDELQARLSALSRRPEFAGRSAVVLFEGFDAAGKGGAIRRITHALDARIFKVIPIAAPTDEDLAQPYLWRFWRHLPRKGRFAIFDRSWYGRVLVERVEKLTAPAVWLRAYGEINDFEAEMVRHGIIVVKFWLSISPGEQLKRFKSRQNTAYKNYKLTDDDWHNRAKWPEYALAVNDMIDRTSSENAPWTLIEAEDKKYARVKIMRVLCEAIEKAL
jgi:polyphosphate:AMP phosphotransferase